MLKTAGQELGLAEVQEALQHKQPDSEAGNKLLALLPLECLPC